MHNEERALSAYEELGPSAHPERSRLSMHSPRAPVDVRRADMHDLAPVDRTEFGAVIGPCLALTGGVGMSAGDQRTWLEAAFIALEGLPIGLLERGARHAMQTVDHPSKIVPAIVREVRSDWEWRKRMADAEPRWTVVHSPRPALAAPPLSGDEVAKVMASAIGRDLLKMAEPRGWLVPDDSAAGFRDAGASR